MFFSLAATTTRFTAIRPAAAPQLRLLSSTAFVHAPRRSLLTPLPSVLTGAASPTPRPSKEALSAHYNQFLDIEEVDPATTTPLTTSTTPVTPSTSTKEEAESSPAIHLVDESASYRLSLA